ncbi:MAG TPA: histidine kinase [Gemmatimonadaceae bacterium]|nr:histidine kinase [Gemmatimonadaceae bacterium]
MMPSPDPRLRTVRAAAMLFFAWLAFYLLQAVISMALPPRSALGPRDWLAIDVTIAALWTGLSAVIARWHAKVRDFAPNVFVIVAAHVPLFVIAAVLDAWLARIVIHALNPATVAIPFWGTVSFYADFDLVSYVAVVAISEALTMRRAAAARQRRERRLEAAMRRARLDILETQLGPHFLFNALGTVAELAHESPAGAAYMLRQLAASVRGALASRRGEVTLGEELIAVEPYLDIQRLRFADWLRLDYRIDDRCVDCLVPRFVLQPLIENAIRHGLRGREQPGTIEIAASIEDGALVIRVSDDGVGLGRVRGASNGHGIGLTNVRERLRILYGGEDRVRLIDTAPGTVAEIRVPVRRRGDPTLFETEPEQDSDGGSLESPRTPPARSRRVANQAAIVVGAWLLCAAVWVQQSYFYLLVRQRLNTASWSDVIRFDVSNAALWMMLTPVVLWIVPRVHKLAHGAWPRAAAHATLAVGLTMLHVDLLRSITAPNTALFSSTYRTNFVVDLAVYLVLAAIASRASLAAWVRARDANAADLARQLSALEARATALQTVPSALLEAIDRIAENVGRDAALTERQLARLGDYLRAALEATDDDGTTPERRRRLDLATAELRATGVTLAVAG